jgi:plastocyanin
MKAFRVFPILALVALVAAFAGGCGGDDDNDNEATTSTTQTTATEPSGGGGGATTVSMDEYKFDPDALSVSRGDTLTVENKGSIGHNLTIEKGPDPKKKSQKLAGTSTFLPDKSEKLTVDLSPGKYAIVCTVAGHRELGMTGTITVK